MRTGDTVRFKDDGRVGYVEAKGRYQNWVLVRLPNGSVLIGPRESFEPVAAEQTGVRWCMCECHEIGAHAMHMIPCCDLDEQQYMQHGRVIQAQLDAAIAREVKRRSEGGGT